jgi:hypothetical protein
MKQDTFIQFVMAFTSDYELWRNITGQWRISHKILSRLCICTKYTKYTNGFLRMKNETPETEPVHQSPFLEVNNYKLKPFVTLHRVDW